MKDSSGVGATLDNVYSENLEDCKVHSSVKPVYLEESGLAFPI